MPYMRNWHRFLYDDVTHDLVGYKDDDGGELYFQRVPHVGHFVDMANQFDDDAPTAMNFGTTVLSRGVSLVGTDTIKVSRAALYNWHLSVHLHNEDSQEQLFEMWGRLNGDDIPGSRFIYSVPSKHGLTPGTIIPSQNFFLDLNANDEVQIVWTTDDAVNVSIAYHSAETGASPKPAAPSLILTVNEVMR